MKRRAIAAGGFLAINGVFVSSGAAGPFVSVVGSGYLIGLIMLAGRLHGIVTLLLTIITPVCLFASAVAWLSAVACSGLILIRIAMKRREMKVERMFWWSILLLALFMCGGWAEWNFIQRSNEANPMQEHWMTEGLEHLVFPGILVGLSLLALSSKKTSNKPAMATP